MRHVTAAALFGLLAIAPVSGQNTQAESVLDRIVAVQPNGGPYALTPPLPDWSDGAALSVGRAAGIVVGFEAAPEVKEVGAVATKEIAAELKIHRHVSLAGKTVREALDAIVAIDPRYRWIDIHGVPVMRPWASWTDTKHPLNQVVAPVQWPEIDLATALSRVASLVSGGDVAQPVAGAGRGPVFAVRTGPIAVMELLNSIGLAHGGAVTWSMRHRCGPFDRQSIWIELQARDGYQVWGLGSCRPARPSDATAHPQP